MSTTTTSTSVEKLQGDTCVAFTIPLNLKGENAWNYAKDEVHARWSGVISTIFATGDLLNDMKIRQKHEKDGTWEKWVKKNLPFCNRTDQRLRAIAAFKPFHGEEVRSVLPAYWGNLDMLRSKAEKAPNRFQNLLSERKITPSISRKKIKDFFVIDDEVASSSADDAADADAADTFKQIQAESEKIELPPQHDQNIPRYSDRALVHMEKRGTLRFYRAELQVQLDRVDAVIASAATVANDAQAEAA
jgi:hypothetical protein